jgi:hypothetical protein
MSQLFNLINQPLCPLHYALCFNVSYRPEAAIEEPVSRNPQLATRNPIRPFVALFLPAQI